jgi:hypothetical protein
LSLSVVVVVVVVVVTHSHIMSLVSCNVTKRKKNEEIKKKKIEKKILNALEIHGTITAEKYILVIPLRTVSTIATVEPIR